MTQTIQKIEIYAAEEFPALDGMPGFSEQLMSDHLKLYRGYVTNTNVLTEKLTDMLSVGGEKMPEYAELKRRFGWEFNGMRLHELYFGNLGGDGVLPPKSQIYAKLREAFGGVEAWKKEFTGMGAMRGVGWVALYRDDKTGRVFNVWVNEHDTGHLAGCTPLLVMDVFEHAYLTDYRLERARYIEAFTQVVDWTAVEKRFMDER